MVVFKTIVLKNDRCFVNDAPSLTIVNYKPSLTIISNDPSLTIVNDDTFINDCKRREETDLKPEGHLYLTLNSF